MKAKEVAKILLETPELDVLFQDPNSNGGPFSVESAQLRIAAKDEFPEDFDMPEGFTFILLEA